MIREIDTQYDGNALKKYIDKFSDTRIVVIGDIILDEYIWGDVSRISPEAPVPVVDIKLETKMLGGAANVINNIESLGGRPVLCGVVGEDAAGSQIMNEVRDMGLPTKGIIMEQGRPTSIKTRVVAHNQQVVRFDRESRKEIGTKSTKRILEFVQGERKRLHGIIVADYGKGVITAELMDGLRSAVSDSDVILAVDPKVGNFDFYRNMDVITPNHYEAGAFCRMEVKNDETLVSAGRQMLEELSCQAVLITQGKDGMTLFEKGGEISHISTVARKVYDVTGAGDTVIGTLCLGLASGMDLKTAAIISNIAAGIVVGEVGTSTVKADELKKVINDRLL